MIATLWIYHKIFFVTWFNQNKIQKHSGPPQNPWSHRQKGKKGIFSEIDEPLDFNETLINGSVLNVVSMNKIRFLQNSLLRKLSAFEVV